MIESSLNVLQKTKNVSQCTKITLNVLNSLLIISSPCFRTGELMHVSFRLLKFELMTMFFLLQKTKRNIHHVIMNDNYHQINNVR